MVVETAAKTVEVSGLNLYYGPFLAVKDVNVTIWRKGREQTIKARVGELKEDEVATAKQEDTKREEPAKPRKATRGPLVAVDP